MDDAESKSVLGVRTPVLVVITSLVLGGIAFLVSYITGRFPARRSKNGCKYASGGREGKTIDDSGNSLSGDRCVSGMEKNNEDGATGGNGNSSNTASTGKRAKNKKRREAQQQFRHMWMVGALKGHTAGRVLDMNFSSDGKFLASCAEDCGLAPEAEPEELEDASSGGEGEFVSPPPPQPPPPTTTTTTTTATTTSGRSIRRKVVQGTSESSKGTSNPGSSVAIGNAKAEESASRSGAASPTKERSSGGEGASLSRRQRKNRTRAPREQQRRDRDDDNDDENTQSSLVLSSPSASASPSPPHRHSHRRDETPSADGSQTSSRHRHHHHRPSLARRSELDSRLHFRRRESPSRDTTDSASSSNPTNGRNARRTSVRRSSDSKIRVNDVKNGCGSIGTIDTNCAGVPVVSGSKNSSSVGGGSDGSSGPWKKSKNCKSWSVQHHRPHHHRDGVSSQRDELNHLSDAALATLLRQYTLSGMQLAHLGYPVECSYFPGCAVILNHQQHPMGHRATRARRQHHLDANAREFVPGNNSGSTASDRSWGTTECEVDSGNGSGSSLESSDFEPECSSDSDKSSDIGESLSSSSSSCSSSSSSSSESSYNEKSARDYSRSCLESRRDPKTAITTPVLDERPCVRCHKTFYVNRENGKYVREEKCVYHWGKLRNGHHEQRPQSGGSVSGGGGGDASDTWECCQGGEGALGCTKARTHVWTGLCPGYNGPFEGYVRTRPSRVLARDGNYGVYALDCEMCFTVRGLELAKVTVVGMDGRIVYDTLVKPDDEVIDHNTRFSGITAKDLEGATKSLRDVQKDITSFVHAETILIGHGLENDLRALRLLHTMVIDTCVAFPHFLGYPFRSSLKTLARTVLGREIQVTEHDSVEDARIAVDLMLRRLRHDLS